MRVNIYIASGVKGLKRQNGVVGFVLESDGVKPLTMFGSVKDATENQAQLLALKYALSRIHDKSDLHIYTASAYLTAALEQGWLQSWKERGWTTAKGREIANLTEWKAVSELLGESRPAVTNETHSYASWMESEIRRRSEKYV